MEHSYSRDFRPMENSQTATTRTLMVHRPPQCPSCHTHTSGTAHDERIDLEDKNDTPIPSYNEESAKVAMLESETVTKAVRNLNSEEVDWEEKINKIGWTVQQIRLFSKITKLLDMDRLARLTIADKQHEPVHRRMVIDKSVARLRQALASVSWDPRLTQWIHGLLMESLPPSYLAAYIDILQTLKAKLPNLVDKMIFGRPLNINQDLLTPVLKKPWEPVVAHKNRKLPGQPYIVVVPSGPNLASPSSRLQKWYSLFATMASVVPITMPPGGNINKQSVQTVSEQMVAVTRAKIQDVRQEAPNRPIILVGFNAGAALAIQIGLVEAVSSIVCLGFAYNTVNGTRGAPDDHITGVTAPVLFVIGQMSARTSQEEIEWLRERMIAQTSLVVVGSADDCLRVCKTKRKIEGVTQSMVDNMVMDEVAEFTTNWLLNPPRPKPAIKDPNGQPKSNLLLSNNSSNLAATGGPAVIPSAPPPPIAANRKRRMSHSAGAVDGEPPKAARTINKQPAKRTPKVPKQPRAEKLLLQQSQKALDAAIMSILPEAEKAPEPMIKKTGSPVTNFQISGGGSGTSGLEIRSSAGPQIVSGLASSPIVLPMIKRESTPQSQPGQLLSPTMTTTPSNIKVIPANQFIQLKPSGSTQKFITLKSSPKPVVSIVPKSGSSAPGTTLQSFSPTKYTIVRNTGAVASTPTTGVPTKSTKTPPTPDLSNTNIFDIPIVFADSEGNIQDGSPQKTSTAPPTTALPSHTNIVTIASSTRTESGGGNRLITLQPSTKPNKVVVINKNNIKQVPPGASIQLANRPATVTPTGVKYAKVVLSNPLTAKTTHPPPSVGKILPSGKVEIINSAVVKPATTTGSSKYAPIIINSKNFVRVGDTQIRATTTTLNQQPQLAPGLPGTNTILIKTNSLAQLSAATRKPTILNRNLTVKRVNLVPSTTSITPVGGGAGQQQQSQQQPKAPQG
uniref:Putative testis development protein prtd n=1 Tax=Culex tarsalis TaxID=7177 RepID=A0A1Q3EYL9_CULTA